MQPAAEIAAHAMPYSTCPTVGAIALEPVSGSRWLPATDDSSLESLLVSLAHRPALDDSVLVARTRWTCPGSEPAVESIRVDLAQLLVDLQADYDAVAHRLSC